MRVCRVDSAAANRLHDLDLITVMERVLRVPAAWHDFAIDFDRDAVLAMAGLVKQLGDCRCRLALVCLAIELDLHLQSVAPVKVSGMPWRRQGSASVQISARPERRPAGPKSKNGSVSISFAKLTTLNANGFIIELTHYRWKACIARPMCVSLPSTPSMRV